MHQESTDSWPSTNVFRSYRSSITVLLSDVFLDVGKYSKNIYVILAWTIHEFASTTTTLILVNIF